MTYQPRTDRSKKHAATPEEIERTISYLSRAFSNATFKAIHIIGNKAERSFTATTTELYEYQVDFAYLVDNIQRCPAYIVPKYVQEANDLITGIKALVGNQ